MRRLEKNSSFQIIFCPLIWVDVSDFLWNSCYCRWCPVVIQSNNSAFDPFHMCGTLRQGFSFPAVCLYLSASLPLSLSVHLSVLVEIPMLLIWLYFFPVIENYCIEIPIQYLIYLWNIKMRKTRKAKNLNKSGFLSHLKCFFLEISIIYVVADFWPFSIGNFFQVLVDIANLNQEKRFYPKSIV